VRNLDQELLERMVKEVMASLAGNKTVSNDESPKSTNRVNRQDYLLYDDRDIRRIVKSEEIK